MMRFLFTAGLVGLGAFAAPATVKAQTTERLNPMIAAHEKGLPIFGIQHPSIGRGGGGGGGGGRGGGARGGGARAGGAAAAGGAVTGGTVTGSAVAGGTTAGAGGAAGSNTGAAAGAVAAAPERPAPPPIVLADVAKETFAYKLADFNFTATNNETFLQYMKEITALGGSVRTHPFIAKIPRWQGNAENAAAATYRQLNAGHVGIMMQYIESPEELKAGIAAMRFKSAGGTRPDSAIDAAAAYWGLTPAQYRQKADVWPLNKNGELVVWAIVESMVGVEKAREIAATPGLGVLWIGWGTMNGVVNGDQVAREAAAQKVLDACKEFKVPCGFPTNNPAEITARMAQGWSVFLMQSRNENGFAAIETGRKLSGR
jgi:4-hydroxy-2-oxoheptanedioate aldolase